MRIVFAKTFSKQLEKLPANAQKAFVERFRIFIEEPFNTLLRNHKLHGEYADCRSINVSGGIRAVYRNLAPDFVQFIAIGTHSDLYN